MSQQIIVVVQGSTSRKRICNDPISNRIRNLVNVCDYVDKRLIICVLYDHAMVFNVLQKIAVNIFFLPFGLQELDTQGEFGTKIFQIKPS